MDIKDVYTLEDLAAYLDEETEATRQGMAYYVGVDPEEAGRLLKEIRGFERAAGRVREAIAAQAPPPPPAKCKLGHTLIGTHCYKCYVGEK